MKLTLLILCLAGTHLLTAQHSINSTASPNDLVFANLATSWDEAMPLGNGIIGALVWQKGGNLRLSVDRVDLWDLRPTSFAGKDNFTFKWIKEQLDGKTYQNVIKEFDVVYNLFPAPSKIPGAAIEFDLSSLGEVSGNRLHVSDGVCEVTWKNGATLKTYVHAESNVGYFIFENIDDDLAPRIVPPAYKRDEAAAKQDKPPAQSIAKLGYKQGKVTQKGDMLTYHQQGWGGFYYDVAVTWKRKGKTLTGTWSITSSPGKEKAGDLATRALEREEKLYPEHKQWWRQFWDRSSVTLPDDVLQKQYVREIYKFGSAARENSHPISLQAVWTADNGELPPWKGDYHHDLNTQLSYWPCYTGNYLNEGLGYLNTLWNQREVSKKYTKAFFGTNGLNVPGVATLAGEPMGGWTQYSCSPTVSAWLAHHFYLHWKYSGDKQFLKEKGYPFIKETGIFLKEFSVLENGVRKLPLSSSPEIHDNRPAAWFRNTTNYDLALMKFVFKAAAEMASELRLPQEAGEWKQLLSELPELDFDDNTGLTFAPGTPYTSSHRHFSHLMAIHPLGLIDWSHGDQSREIIRKTVAALDEKGPSAWCGYSYSWLGNIKARMMDGEGAAKALRDFANCFCLRNTFHANGDQSRTGKSGYTYRPFTLEGNFAFASGIQEMLLQSHTGIINLFPAIPASWKDVSFDTLRAQGAFLVSAEMKGGTLERVIVKAEQGGLCRINNPFPKKGFSISDGHYSLNGNIIEIKMNPGQQITLTARR